MPWSGALRPGREEEECGLEPLAPDPDEGHRSDGERTERERPVEPAGELPRERPPDRAHPEDHRRHEGDRDERGDPADELLGPLLEFAGAEREHGTQGS